MHEVALAAGTGVSEFHHVVTNDSYSGLRGRRYDRPRESVEVISVATARMDDVIPADLPIAFVKIDVEGGELGVLAGAQRTLARWAPVVVFEHGLGAADYYGTRPEDVYAALSDVELTVSLWIDGSTTSQTSR